MYELEHVVPLAVEDELSQEEHVIGEAAVDDAGLALERQLCDVQVPVVEELQRQTHHVVLAKVQVRRRHR